MSRGIRFRSLTVLSGAIALAALSMPLLTASAEAAPSLGPSEIVYGASALPIPDRSVISRAQLDSLISQAPVMTMHPAVAARPASVASGYTLINPGYRRSDYIYDSDPFYLTASRCGSSGCTLLAQVKAQEHEYVRGGSSKYWDLTENASVYSNPGNLGISYTAIYYCAVNISGNPDHYCGNGADGSGTSAAMTPGQVTAKKFENVSGNIVYPMVGITANFSTGGGTTAKFRGYDTCNKATTTKLCTQSGNGS